MKPLHRIFLTSIVLLASCAPEELTVELFADDIEAARSGPPILVPATLVFSLLGDDQEGLLAKATDIVKQFISPDSKVTTANETMGKKLTITTFIPLGKRDKMLALPEFQKVPLFLELVAQDPTFGSHPLALRLAKNDDKLRELNEALKGVSFLLSFDPVPGSTTFNLTGNRSEAELLVVSAFVNGEAVLKREERLKPRQRLALSFGAGDLRKRSVWDHIAPQFFMK